MGSDLGFARERETLTFDGAESKESHRPTLAREAQQDERIWRKWCNGPVELP